MNPRIARTISIVLTALSFWVSGCQKPFAELRGELRRGGWDLWYPAEYGITPGDVWGFRDGKRELLARRPKGLTLSPSRPISFRSLQSSVDLTGTLKGSDKIGAMGVGSASATLLAQYARRVEINFGDTSVQRLDLDDLEVYLDDNNDSYSSLLEEVRRAPHKQQLITSTVVSSGLSYRVEANNGFSADVVAETLTKELGVDVTVSRTSDNTYLFETPRDVGLVIGVGLLASSEFLWSSVESVQVEAPVRRDKGLYLMTVDVQSRGELRRSFVRQNDSTWLYVTVPMHARQLRFVVRNANGYSPQFDVCDIGLSDDCFARGLQSGGSINVRDWQGEELSFQIANVCRGPAGWILIDVFAD